MFVRVSGDIGEGPEVLIVQNMAALKRVGGAEDPPSLLFNFLIEVGVLYRLKT